MPLLPALVAPARERSLLPERLHGLRTLIVDDVALNIEIMTRQLQNLRHADCSLLQDGTAAVAELERAWRAGLPSDLVLMDQMMPGLAGIRLAEHVRASPNIAETRLVLVTSAGRSDVRRHVGAVLDAVVEKPVRRAELLDCLGRLFDAGAPSRPAAAPVRRRPLSVLLAEDNRVNQQVAMAMLRKAGHSVRVVGNGVEAVAAAAEEDFDIVLMDVQMPLLDGIEATRQIRALPGARGRVPVVALTADAMTGAKEYYLQAGMDDYLAKPIRAAALLAQLDALVPDAPSRLPEVATAPAPQTGAPAG